MLVGLNIAFLVSMLVHAADHLRQGTERLTAEVFWGGTALLILAVATLTLTLRRDPRAPLVCAVTGFWTVLGVSASHLAPHWSAFSDPYPDLSLDALSWAAMLSEVLLGFALGVAGLVEMRRSRTAAVPA